MSRRKQANPAKLGDTESTDMTDEDDASSAKLMKNNEASGTITTAYDECKGILKILNGDDQQHQQHEQEYIENKSIIENCEIKGESDDDDDVDFNEDKINGEENEELDHDSMLMLNVQESSPSSSDQASPASSCQSSIVSDVIDGDEPYTMGATATTPYECNICKRAFARSSVLTKHVQIHTEQLQFSCPYCRRLFKHKRSRDRHTKLHTGDKKYKCVHCDSAFARSDHLKIHMKTHDNKKPHQCELCNRGYNTASALASHQQHHALKEKRCGSSVSFTSAISTPSPENLRCPQCPEIFNKNEQLQNHIITMHKIIENHQIDTNDAFKQNIEIPKIACMYCGKDFLSMTHMYQHINTEHSNLFTNIPHSYQMNASNYNQLTPNVEDLSIRHHNNSPTYACDRCNMKFDSPQLLKDHVDTSHWRPAINTGVLNDINSQQKPTNLSRKRRTDESIDKIKDADTPKQVSPSSAESSYDANDRPCICSYCYVQMPNFKSFLIHMETHVTFNANNTPTTNNPYTKFCPICGEPGRDSIEFSKHIFAHAITNIIGKCCHHCEKYFDQQDQYQKHLIEAHSQTIYKCTFCNDTFDTLTTLSVHFKNKHTGECSHYRCNLCSDQIFHDKVAAEVHISLKHSIQLPTSSLNHQQQSSLNDINYSNIFTEIDTRSLYTSFQCSFCQKTFKDEYMHYLHILKEHNDVRMSENYLLKISSSSSSSSNQKHIPSKSPSYMFNGTSSSPDNNNKLKLKINNYICEICNRSDITCESELVAHKKLHHSKSKIGPVSLQCAYCSEHCKSRNDLENHMKTHQVSCGKGKHKCNICDEIFSSSITLADHKLTHCKIVSGNNCTQCKTVLVDEQCFYKHQLQHSSNSTIGKMNSHLSLPANCIVCCQTLQTDIEIKLHAKFHLRHLQQKDFLCGNCSKVFVGHISTSTKQSNDKCAGNFTVSLCKECTGSNGANIPLDGKQLNKTNLKAYFENDDDMQSHLHMFNENMNLECHLCRNILPSSIKLQAHLIEHNFMGIGQFRCYVCSSVFTTATGLQSHIIGHGFNNRPYECTDCKMKFFFETELENHKYCHRLAAQQLDTYNNQNGLDICYETNKPTNIYKICQYCSKSYHENVYNEHVDFCSNEKIKKEKPNTPDVDYENLDQNNIKDNNGGDLTIKKENDKQ